MKWITILLPVKLKKNIPLSTLKVRHFKIFASMFWFYLNRVVAKPRKGEIAYTCLHDIFKIYNSCAGPNKTILIHYSRGRLFLEVGFWWYNSLTTDLNIHILYGAHIIYSPIQGINLCDHCINYFIVTLCVSLIKTVLLLVNFKNYFLLKKSLLYQYGHKWLLLKKNPFKNYFATCNHCCCESSFTGICE